MRLTPLAALTCATVLLAGCGGGDDAAAPGQEPSSSATATTPAPVPTTSPPTTSPSAAALTPFSADGFTASFPTTPERNSQQVDSPVGKLDVVFYQSLGDEDGYSVSYFELPPGGGIDLPAAIAGSATQVMGTVADETPTSYQGFDARDARITGAFGEGTIFTRVIATPTRLYQLQYLVQGADVASPSADYPQFLESLSFDG